MGLVSRYAPTNQSRVISIVGVACLCVCVQADLKDDVELFETVDEIAGALQLADQYCCACGHRCIHARPPTLP